jgi:hypothetical protein
MWYTWLLVCDLETKITKPKNIRNSIKAEKRWREVRRRREGKNINGGMQTKKTHTSNTLGCLP